MVPDREKDLLRNIRDSSKTFLDLRVALDWVVIEKRKVPSPMDIGSLEGASGAAGGAAAVSAGTQDTEVENPKSGEMDIFRRGVSGQWSKTGVKQRKKPGPNPANTGVETPRRQRIAE